MWNRIITDKNTMRATTWNLSVAPTLEKESLLAK